MSNFRQNETNDFAGAAAGQKNSKIEKTNKSRKE